MKCLTSITSMKRQDVTAAAAAAAGAFEAVTNLGSNVGVLRPLDVLRRPPRPPLPPREEAAILNQMRRGSSALLLLPSSSPLLSPS